MICYSTDHWNSPPYEKKKQKKNCIERASKMGSIFWLADIQKSCPVQTLAYTRTHACFGLSFCLIFMFWPFSHLAPCVHSLSWLNCFFVYFFLTLRSILFGLHSLICILVLHFLNTPLCLTWRVHNFFFSFALLERATIRSAKTHHFPLIERPYSHWLYPLPKVRSTYSVLHPSTDPLQ